jgi:hypothetical protein
MVVNRNRTNPVLQSCVNKYKKQQDSVLDKKKKGGVNTHVDRNVFGFFLLVYWGVESNWVHSALRPLIGLLCQPRVIMMEKLVE